MIRLALNIVPAILLGAALSGCASTSVPGASLSKSNECISGSAGYVTSRARQQRSVLVLASDEHPETVRRSLPLVDRVGRALMNELVSSELRLFDVHGLTQTLPVSKRVAVPRLLEYARNDTREPIDRLVVYSLFADTYPGVTGFQASLRVMARLYDLAGGIMVVGDFEASDQIDLQLPAVCDSACFTALIGNAARPLALEVGQALRAELQRHGNSYPLELFGFDNRERAQIEHGLRRFPGYQSHRVEEDGALYVRMRYASSLVAADLSHNLRRLTACLDLPSQVEFAGSRYAVRRSANSQENIDG